MGKIYLSYSHHRETNIYNERTTSVMNITLTDILLENIVCNVTIFYLKLTVFSQRSNKYLKIMMQIVF